MSDPKPLALFVSRFIATGAFTGYIPWASGTFGTLVGIAIYLIPGFSESPILAILIGAGFFAGAIAADRVAQVEGHRLTKSAAFTKEIFSDGSHNTPDPSIVVIDEIVGIWIALFLLPKSLVLVVAAFLIFRVLDIVKPFPARRLEQIPHGWGIMLDDIVAGMYTNFALHIGILIVHMFAPGVLF